jgi:hypothetical protein
MRDSIYNTLDTIIDHLDTDLGLSYLLKERVSMGRSTSHVLDEAELYSYDMLFNFSALPFKERMSKISSILFIVGQFLVEVLKKFNSPSGFKIRWYQYPAAVSLLIKFIYDLKNPKPVE